MARSGPAFLTLLLLTVTAQAAPADSLTGIDMREEYTARRAAFAESLGEGTCLVASREPCSHQEYRQYKDLLWLTGIEESCAALVLRIDHPDATPRARAARILSRRAERALSRLAAIGDRLEGSEQWKLIEAVRDTLRAAAALRDAADSLYQSERGAPRVSERLYLRPLWTGTRWSGPRLTAGPAAAKATGIADVRSIEQLRDDIENGLGKYEILYTPSLGRLTEDVRGWIRSLEATRPDFLVRSCARKLHEARGVKSAEEIARIRRACELTAEGLVDSMRDARPGMFEYELQARLEFACRRGGARRQAFPSVVASGSRALILHYMSSDRGTVDGDLVLMDVGAEFMSYAADVTRTFPVNGRFTARQAELYDLVLKAQTAALAKVRPGANFESVETAAREILIRAGLGEAVLHSIGHHVGLSVHDPAPRGPFRPGMVITVEPGIYLDEEGIGIRIEDTVVVTKEGCDVLSRDAPKVRADIEKLMKR